MFNLILVLGLRWLSNENWPMSDKILTTSMFGHDVQLRIIPKTINLQVIKNLPCRLDEIACYSEYMSVMSLPENVACTKGSN